MGIAVRTSVLTALLLALGCGQVLAQDEYGWDDGGIVDSNHYQVPRGATRTLSGHGLFSPVAPNSAGQSEGGVRARNDLGASAATREWLRLPPRSFSQRDLLGSAAFFGSRPLNYGQGYGTGYGPNYFGNFGNGYGTGESRSYFGNYGSGYGLGESRKY